MLARYRYKKALALLLMFPLYPYWLFKWAAEFFFDDPDDCITIGQIACSIIDITAGIILIISLLWKG
jgi:hypothetical protein